MDPDGIFLILLLLIMVILAVGSIIGLTRKIWKTNLYKAVKLLIIGFIIIVLIVQIFTLGSVNSIWALGMIIFFPSFLISLNWSINIIRKNPYAHIKLPIHLKIILLVIFFIILIPTMFFLIGTFFDKHNLMGNSG